MEILTELENRGIIYQCTNIEGLKKVLKEKKISLYCGFDPTGESLHIGNLLPLITLKRFLEDSFKVIVLIGGGTALIGDPSGKRRERKLLKLEEIKIFKKKIENQIKDFFKNSLNVIFVDNYQWLKNINLIKFLRDLGKDFTISSMLSKESVKERLKTGLSFTEFSYMLLQAYDFYYLAKNYNCLLQIGGSDQWGNITCGIDLIKKRLNKEAFGLTLPLVTKSDGEKFGKTEKGAIFLDKNLTSPYEFYQFWYNTDDKDIIRFLKYYSFLPIEEIKKIEKALKEKPEQRIPQKQLAYEMTELIHGEKEAERAKKISEALFQGEIENLEKRELEELIKVMSLIKIQEKSKLSIFDFLIKSKICSSKSEVRRILNEGILTINGKKVDLNTILEKKDGLFSKYFIIKKGKKNYFFVVWE